MNKDIRILVSFKNHRKRKRLKMVLGESGTDYLIDLWLTAAEDRPDGVLTGWDEIDIAISCGWEGEPQKIVQALIDTKWLNVLEDGTYVLHDWVEHNGYASSAGQRSDKARFSNLKRWHPELAEQLAEQGIDSLTADQFKAITNGQVRDGVEESECDRSPIGTDSDTDPNPNPPSPSPAIRIELPDGNLSEPEVPDQQPPSEVIKGKNKNSPCPQQDIVDLFNKSLPELSYVKAWGKSSQKTLRARWREDPERQTLAWWESFFCEIRASDFLMGRKNEFQATLDWIVKPTNFQKIINGNYTNRKGGANGSGKRGNAKRFDKEYYGESDAGRPNDMF